MRGLINLQTATVIPIAVICTPRSYGRLSGSMAGFQVTINGESLAAVSNVGVNIMFKYMIGDELASVDVYGGKYGNGEIHKHLIN